MSSTYLVFLGKWDYSIRGLFRHTLQQVLEEELMVNLNAEPHELTNEVLSRKWRRSWQELMMRPDFSKIRGVTLD